MSKQSETKATNHEHEGGECPQCNTPAQHRRCTECGTTAWIIDCGHMAQPRPIASGRADGSDLQQHYCDDCAHA